MTYEEYHKAVVDECVRLSQFLYDGESTREFWDKQCSYEDEFREGLTPEECADACIEALE